MIQEDGQYRKIRIEVFVMISFRFASCRIVDAAPVVLLEGAIERYALAIRCSLELELSVRVVEGQHEPQHPTNLGCLHQN